MKITKIATIAICLMAILAFNPLAGFAQAATAFSGQATALKGSALGISLSMADTGPLPSMGGSLSRSVASVNVAGLAVADALKSTTSGRNTSSQSQSQLSDLSLLGGLVTAAAVRSHTSTSCSGSQAAAGGFVSITRLMAAGQSIDVRPNLAISLPGGISLIVDERMSSSGGNTGSITVNALHLKGPGIDIVVASAHSDITCS